MTVWCTRARARTCARCTGRGDVDRPIDIGLLQKLSIVFANASRAVHCNRTRVDSGSEEVNTAAAEFEGRGGFDVAHNK